MSPSGATEALVLGRLHADLYPQQLGVPLENARTFERFVGGFAGNVGVGLARLGIATSVVSAVGDDGHGRFIRRFLDQEGIDTRWVAVDPSARTALTFCEIRPPSDFPLLAYRPPDTPDWQLTPSAVPFDLVRETALMLVSGTAFAVDPSRATTRAAMAERRERGADRPTLLDLDWRAGYWARPEAYSPRLADAAMLADIVIGSDEEFRVAGLEPGALVTGGARAVYVKHGPDGATLLTRDAVVDAPGQDVEVVNGLGAGDAFAAAVGWGTIRGLGSARILELANTAGAIVAGQIECSGAMPTESELRERAATAVDKVGDPVRDRVR
jgi:5-dehydro-2-deoxygluconokinase